MSFFVSNSIKDVIDEKTYLSQENSEGLKYVFKINKHELFFKNNFESMTFEKEQKINLIDFSLTLKEVNMILFKDNIKLEIPEKHNLSLNLLKITKIDNNNYYCQYKVKGEHYD